MHFTSRSIRLQRLFANPAWALVAAFGTYFCMYGFRKPYTAATYNGVLFFGLDYKTMLIISQTIGYVLAKWIGIKIVSEIKPIKRIGAILSLIVFAEVMLLLFGAIPKPWNAICLLLNGLPLGIIFGLVLSFVEGRKNTEFLIAGLCASFIVLYGVSKSVGAMLLGLGVTEQWMPFLAGLVFAGPTLLFIAMLACVPKPSVNDVASRSAREPMTGKDRVVFFKKYAPGIICIVLVYLLATLLRSVRADFAVEIWAGLGYKQTPQLFTQSELLVSLSVLAIVGFATFIKNHQTAFDFSLYISFVGLAILLLAFTGFNLGVEKFTLMILIGLGVYLPYVAVHAIVFERLIAITRGKATVSFLMYIADSVGYTGYIALMLLRYIAPPTTSLLAIFLQMCLVLGILGIVLTIFTYCYFKYKLKNNEQTTTHIAGRQSYIV
jgi:hypothetical protein